MSRIYLLGLIVLVSCITDGTPRLEVTGQIDDEREAAIRVPQSAAVGVSFDVLVETNGGGCFQGGRTIVRQMGMIVEIEPRDLVSVGGPAECNGNYEVYHHNVRLQFDQPGSATVTIVGIRHWRISGPIDTVRIIRTVVVR